MKHLHSLGSLEGVVCHGNQCGSVQGITCQGLVGTTAHMARLALPSGSDFSLEALAGAAAQPCFWQSRSW